jgi:hypothetical protein
MSGVDPGHLEWGCEVVVCGDALLPSLRRTACQEGETSHGEYV